jgi:hypothetical protein
MEASIPLLLRKSLCIYYFYLSDHLKNPHFLKHTIYSLFSCTFQTLLSRHLTDYSINSANTPPTKAAANDVLTSVPFTPALLPPPALTVADGDVLAVDEEVLLHVSPLLAKLLRIKSHHSK